MKKIVLLLSILFLFKMSYSQNIEQNNVNIDSLLKYGKIISQDEFNADMALLNNQMAQFKTYETLSLSFLTGAFFIGILPFALEIRDNASTILFATAGVCGLTSVAFHYVACFKIKRNSLYVTANGVIFKF